MTLYSKRAHNQNNTTTNSFVLNCLGFLIFLRFLIAFFCDFYAHLFFYPIFLFLLTLKTTHKQNNVHKLNFFLCLRVVFLIQTANNLEKINNKVLTPLFTPGVNLA